MPTKRQRYKQTDNSDSLFNQSQEEQPKENNTTKQEDNQNSNPITSKDQKQQKDNSKSQNNNSSIKVVSSNSSDCDVDDANSDYSDSDYDDGHYIGVQNIGFNNHFYNIKAIRSCLIHNGINDSEDVIGLGLLSFVKNTINKLKQIYKENQIFEIGNKNFCPKEFFSQQNKKANMEEEDYSDKGFTDTVSSYVGVSDPLYAYRVQQNRQEEIEHFYIKDLLEDKEFNKKTYYWSKRQNFDEDKEIYKIVMRRNSTKINKTVEKKKNNNEQNDIINYFFNNNTIEKDNEEEGEIVLAKRNGVDRNYIKKKKKVFLKLEHLIVYLEGEQRYRKSHHLVKAYLGR